MEYKSKSQIARIKTEEWALKSLFCPICGKTFTESSNNTKVYDFSCVECEQFFQLKAHAKKIGKKLIGSEYYSFIKSLEESIIPNFLLMHYELEEGEIIVQRVIFIPKTFITPEVVEKRKPLSSTAKRAGWTGYNLLLDKIPTYGITEMLTSCKIKDKTERAYNAGAYIINNSWGSSTRITGTTESGVVMSLRHKTLPIEGVQFHPESVLTEHGHLMLANWLTQCGDKNALAKSVGLSPVVGRSS